MMKTHAWILGAAGLLAAGCAYNATGTLPQATLIFEYSIEGQNLYRGDNLAYYFVVNAAPDQPGRNVTGATVPEAEAVAGNPEKAPLINGGTPETFPFPDPRSYLPFVRDESAVLDRKTVSNPYSFWTDFFALYEEAGQFVMWHGRRNDDGTINERYRQLQQGREWGIENNKTIQLTIPFRQLAFTNPDAPPPQIPANVAVALRLLEDPPPEPITDPTPRSVLDRWGQTKDFSFAIQTRPINQNLYDTIGTITFPQNLPAGLEPASVNLTTITYRVVRE